jgi:hypothetical protein
MKFFLQFNFRDRRLKNAKSKVEISLVLFFFIFLTFVKYRVRQQILCTATTNFRAAAIDVIGHRSRCPLYYYIAGH